MSSTFSKSIENNLQSEIQDSHCEYNYWFKKPNQNELKFFFSSHPIQPKFDDLNCTKLYKRKDGILRNWLSFNSVKNSFFCSVCLAFCRNIEDDKNARFVKYGLEKNSKHLYQRIDEHELSKNHSDCAESFMLLKNQLSI